ncbi:MAG: hypothetical protein NC400_00495 [Clostridium sp.]|nr:hypothetical protein [Clostridium sp.]
MKGKKEREISGIVYETSLGKTRDEAIYQIYLRKPKYTLEDAEKEYKQFVEKGIIKEWTKIWHHNVNGIGDDEIRDFLGEKRRGRL